MIIKLTETWIALIMSVAALLFVDLVSTLVKAQDPRTRAAAFVMFVLWIGVSGAVLIVGNR